MVYWGRIYWYFRDTEKNSQTFLPPLSCLGRPEFQDWSHIGIVSWNSVCWQFVNSLFCFLPFYVVLGSAYFLLFPWHFLFTNAMPCVLSSVMIVCLYTECFGLAVEWQNIFLYKVLRFIRCMVAYLTAVRAGIFCRQLWSIYSWLAVIDFRSLQRPVSYHLSSQNSCWISATVTSWNMFPT